MPKFKSTKTYEHNEGLSCVFRQWRATKSHCSLLHGYALKFKVVFGCKELDDRNWVQDFGGLKPFKEWLHYTFDHTVLVASDDPLLAAFSNMQAIGLCKTRVLDGVGCEKIAELTFKWLEHFLDETDKRVTVESVEVSEHAGNSALYTL